MKTAARLQQAFETIPLLQGLAPSDFYISELRGYTNWNFRLQDQQRDWVLRIPRPETNRFINREAEAHNQVLASAAGLAPACLWRNNEGMTITATLAAGRELLPADFDHGAVCDLVGRRLWQLHDSRLEFQGLLHIGEEIERYYRLLSPTGQESLSTSYQQAQRLLAGLERHDRPVCPSHSDPVLENLLLEQDRLWLIDWEYSAMASPYWDLATVANAAGMGARQSAGLLRGYCAGGAIMEESKLHNYRQLLQLLNDCWMAVFANRDQ